MAELAHRVLVTSHEAQDLSAPRDIIVNKAVSNSSWQQSGKQSCALLLVKLVYQEGVVAMASPGCRKLGNGSIG